MTGRRLSDGTDWSSAWQPGDYAKLSESYLIVCTPNGEVGVIEIKGPRAWKMIEHEDGTITISPSILIYPGKDIDGPRPGWHGFLERGIWRSC